MICKTFYKKDLQVFLLINLTAPANWALEKVYGTDDHIRIKNQATGEYLYAETDDLAYDTERRRVFTWTDTSTTPTSNPSFWENKADWEVDDEDGFYQLKNIRFYEYLYAAADDLAFDESSRSVFTWKNEDTLGPEGLWKFSKNIKGDLCFYK
jgi:hypothetical protein